MKYLLLLSLPSAITCIGLYWLSGRFHAGEMDKRLSEKPSRIFLGLSIALISALMLHFAFMQDDAYISFRYSQNLALGNGLSWNPSDNPPVQGYTNFLWVILMAAPHALGLNIEYSALTIGILLGLLTICVTYLLSFNIFRDRGQALLPTWFLSSNFSFLSYATGGLETQLATFVGILAWYLATLPLAGGDRTAPSAVPRRNPNRVLGLLALISLVVAIAYLTRMDTLLITGPCILFLVVKILRQPGSGRTKLGELLALALPFAAIAIAYSTFSIHVYGSLLPNTFYIKARTFSFPNIIYGGYYVAQFFIFYGLAAIFVLIFLLRARLCSEKTQSPDVWLYLFITVGLTIFYSLRVGGDFMEFRFLVPIMPVLFLILVKELLLLGSRLILVALISLPIFSAANALGLFPRLYGVESFRQLNGHLHSPAENWIGIGKKLKAIFPSANEELTIGVTPAGAIPYYSGLRSIDLLGLNDRFIAKQGVVIGTRPGHTRGPTLEYLYKSQINLLIGHPQVRHRSQQFSLETYMRSFCWFMSQSDCRSLSRSGPKVLTMAIDEDFVLDMIYLIPSKHVEEALAQQLISVAYPGGTTAQTR